MMEKFAAILAVVGAAIILLNFRILTVEASTAMLVGAVLILIASVIYALALLIEDCQ